MPFDEITERVEAKASAPPVSVRLMMRKAGKTSLRVTVIEKLVRGLKWAKIKSAGLAVGRGEDAGKIVIRGLVTEDGIAKVLSGKYHLNIDFGHVAALGNFGRQLTAAKSHEVVDQGKSLVVTLPDPWPEQLADDGGDDEDETEPSQKVHPPAPRAPPGETTLSVPPQAMAVQNAGISVSISPPLVKVGKLRTDLLINEAKVLVPLVRSFNCALARSALAKTAFLGTGKTAQDAEATVELAVGGLQIRLPKVGLKLTHTKDIGYTLGLY